MSNFGFRMMSFIFRVRDILSPPENILQEVIIEPGFYILDYGCGPGSYSIAASKLVGDTGKVYALDIHPLAIKHLQEIASKKGLSNIEVIQSDCETGLPDCSVDLILLYDVFHHLDYSYEILKELSRILKPNGILSFSDHHMEEEAILTGMTDKGLFRLSKKGERTYSFLKVW